MRCARFLKQQLRCVPTKHIIRRLAIRLPYIARRVSHAGAEHITSIAVELKYRASVRRRVSSC